MKKDIFYIKNPLKIDGKNYTYYNLSELQKKGYDINKMPFSIRILLENALRNYDGFAVSRENI